MTDPYDPLANARDAVNNDWGANPHARTDRIFKAMMLAPTLDICIALLQGKPVPVDRMDAKWARRYGIVRKAA